MVNIVSRRALLDKPAVAPGPTRHSSLPTRLSFLDTVTSAAAPISPPMRGTTPPVTVNAFRLLRRDGPINRARKCAGARG